MKAKTRSSTLNIKNIGLIASLVLALVLRFYSLGSQSLWKDEIFSATEAKKPILELLVTKSWTYYGYAPVHYVFTHLAMFFGTSDFVLRFPAAALGTLAVFIFYLFVRDIFGKKTGLIAAFLLAISVIHIQYSREVRYYSYLAFFSSLTFLSAYNLVAQKKKGRWLTLFVGSTIFNIATQLTAVLVLGAEIVFFSSMLCLSFIKRGSLRRLSAASKSKVKKIILGVFIVIALALVIRFLNSFLDFFKSSIFKPEMPLSEYIPLILTSFSGSRILVFLFVPLALLGIFKGFHKNKDGTILLLLSLFIPITLIYFYRHAVNGFQVRYVIFIVFPFLAFVAVGIDRIVRNNQLALAAVLLVIMGLTLSPLRQYYQTSRGDWRGAANFIKENGERGDVVIPDGDYNVMLLDYYLESEKNGFVIKKPIAPLSPQVVPFRVFYYQHDYQNPDGTLNLGELFITDFEKTKSFPAAVSPMHLVVSYPIYYWREAEEPDENTGWSVLDFYGQKMIRTDFNPEKAVITYKISVPQEGKYALYANLRLDNLPGLLKFRLDKGDWSEGFQPRWDGKGARTKEAKLGTLYLTAEEHLLSFRVQKTGTDNQAIDYFYLIKDDRQ